MHKKELNLSKKYTMPNNIFIKDIKEHKIILSIDTACWLLLNDDTELSIYNFLAAGNTIKETLDKFSGDRKSVFSVLRELEAKHFEDLTVIRPPENGMYIYLTNKCNLRCHHCYMLSGEANENELNTSEIKKLLHEFVDFGGKAVMFTGGEATLRDDLVEILREAKSLELSTGILSNGILWTDSMIENIYPFLDEVQISIDGYDDKTYMSVRGINGFGIAKNTVEKLLKKNVRTTVAITPLQDTLINKEHNYIKFIENMLKKWADYPFFIKINTELMSGRDITPTEKENIIYKKSIRKIKDSFPQFADYKGFALDHKYHCVIENCGYGGLSIASNGDVFFCNLTSKCAKQGNIRNNKLSDILNISKKAKALSSVNNLIPCRDCPLKYLCGGGCRVRHFTELANKEINTNMSTDNAFSRIDFCDEDYKNRFYINMIKANKLFYY